MRLRSLVLLAVAASSFAATPRAFAQQTDPMADGLQRGDYFRLSAGTVTPVNPSGSLRDWGRGVGGNLMWENWDLSGSSGQMGLFGFSLFGDLSFLPFKEEQFKTDFAKGPNGAVLRASASKARVVQLGVNTRLRIPMRYIMPSISVGFGFLDWHPGNIDYTTASGSFKAKQQNRQGGAITLTGALDKHLFDRYALFGEAVYTYGFTSWGQVAGSSSTCVTNECDLLKNTPLGVIRGGLRYRYK
jgi:hypothetical protein